MEQYTLEVSGVDGTLAATLKIGNDVIDTFPVKDLKDARRQSRAVALEHRNSNRPARLERYTENFSL